MASVLTLVSGLLSNWFYCTWGSVGSTLCSECTASDPHQSAYKRPSVSSQYPFHRRSPWTLYLTVGAPTSTPISTLFETTLCYTMFQRPRVVLVDVKSLLFEVLTMFTLLVLFVGRRGSSKYTDGSNLWMTCEKGLEAYLVGWWTFFPTCLSIALKSILVLVIGNGRDIRTK
jgi:hypothetical protein